MRRRWPLLLLILAPLIALWPGLTGLAVGPFDAIRAMAPWNGPAPSGPWDVLMADSVLQSHVWRTLVLDAWGKGQLPFWNPYEFAGTPLLANSQSGGFYPPHIVLGLLHVPAGPAGFFLAWFHLALAGVGTYALVRRLGGSVPGGVTAGLAFVLSPFMLGWAPLSSVVATLAWLPLALACVVAGDRRSTAALAACVAMILLAGHLQFAAYGLLAIVAMAAGHFSLREGEAVRRPSAVAGAALALILGAALAAPQLLPVLSYSKESHRRNAPTAEGYEDYVRSSLKPFELATLAHPMALGSPREASEVQLAGQRIAAYWTPLVKPGANFAESAVSVGAVVVALLAVVPWRERRTWPLAAIGLVGLLLALGTPLDRLFYFLIPGWSSTGSPGRAEVLFVLAACALSGLAVDRLSQRSMQLGGIVAAIVGLVLAMVLPNLATAEGPAAALRGAATAGLLPIALVATVLTVFGLFAAKRSLWTVPATVAVVACLSHALVLVPFGRPLDPVQGDPNARIAVVNDVWDILTAQPAVLPPNLAALSGLHELAGYDSLTSRNTVEMLRTVNGGQDPAPPVNGNMMFVKPSADPKALAEAGVTEVWSRRFLPQLGNAPEVRTGYLVYSVAGPGRASGGRVTDRYDGQEVRGQGTVVVRDRLTEGWTAAEGDLKPSGPDGRWREVSVGNGGVARLRYDPPGFKTGAVLALLGLLGLIGLAKGPRKAAPVE